MRCLNLIAYKTISEHLAKWNPNTNIQLEINDEIEEDSILFLDLISFIKLNLSTKKRYLLKFHYDEIFSQRILTLKPQHIYRPYAAISRIAFYNIRKSLSTSGIFISSIEQINSEIPISKEIWLTPINDPEISSKPYDSDIVNHFRVQRTVYSGDLISINSKSVVAENVFYFKVDVKVSPSIATKTTKIYQSSPQTIQFPKKRISESDIFIPSTIKRIVSDAVGILRRCFSSTKKSPLFMVMAGPIGFGKDLAISLIADNLCVNKLRFDCYDLWSHEGKGMDSVLQSWFEKVKQFSPCVCEVENIMVFDGIVGLEAGDRTLDLLCSRLQNLHDSSAFIFTISKSELSKVPKPLSKLIHFEFLSEHLSNDDHNEYVAFVKKKYTTNIPSKWLKDSVRGLNLAEMKQLSDEAYLYSLMENRSTIIQSDFENALAKRNHSFGEKIGVPNVPTVTWKDVGGLEDVKALIAESLGAQLKSDRRQLARRSGIILHGPPGCGKTLIAKAIANEYKLTFLSVKGPELLNQYIGQSEQNLKEVFDKARQASPSIIFFDELDSLAPSRGIAGDSGGVMDRMVSQLLSELDSLQTKKNCSVFVMGATNRPDLLDPCLLTTGRFDKLVEVKMASDFESKVRILKSVCRKVKIDPSLSIEEIAALCPDEMSGAELSAIISSAAMQSVRRFIKSGTAESDEICITREDLDNILKSS